MRFYKHPLSELQNIIKKFEDKELKTYIINESILHFFLKKVKKFNI